MGCESWERFKKFSDATKYCSGASILQFIFWMYIATAFFFPIMIYFKYKQIEKDYRNRTDIDVQWHLNLIVVTAVIGFIHNCVFGILLRQGWKMGSRRSLIAALMWTWICSSFTNGVSLYLKIFIFDDNDRPKQRIFGFGLQLISLLFHYSAMYHVYLCYKKLGSPLILMLDQYSSNLQENEKVFKGFVINPLNIKIDVTKLLGEGQFGSVYKGNLCIVSSSKPLKMRKYENIEIAAKVARNPENPETFRMLMDEMKIIILAGEHPNIVKFFGVNSDGSTAYIHFAMITEYCGQGSLEVFLKEKRNNLVLKQYGHVYQNLPSEYISKGMLSQDFITNDFLRISQEIARGMEHLASKKIVHGDLATRNVLLTHNHTVKLADFGLSRRLYNYQLYSKGVQGQTLLPWRWMAIETIEDLKFSEKTDVWSFGVTLWEIFTFGEFPFPHLPWNWDTMKKLRDGLRLQKPKYYSQEIYDLMTICWNMDSSQRPTFTELRMFLELDSHSFQSEMHKLIQSQNQICHIAIV